MTIIVKKLIIFFHRKFALKSEFILFRDPNPGPGFRN